MTQPELNELKFFGRITAGFTHELKNVLAIIRESAGLMEDILGLYKQESFPHLERFLRAVNSIQGQVNRGVELSTRLNRFAHSPDEPSATVDMNEAAEQIALLAQRFARLKGVTFRVEPGVPAPSLVANPVHIQMALFLALESCWNQMDSGGEIVLRPEIKDGAAVVGIECVGAIGEPGEFCKRICNGEGWAQLSNLLEILGGTVERREPAAGFSVVLPEGYTPHG